MSVVKEFFRLMGDLRFHKCMDLLGRAKCESTKLKKWLGHLVMCEHEYFQARFGSDGKDSLRARYSSLQGQVISFMKHSPYEPKGKDLNLKNELSRIHDYSMNLHTIVISRQLWSGLINFVHTRERLCSLYNVVSKSRPPHGYDYFSRVTVEITGSMKFTHLFLKKIQDNVAREGEILLKSFRCESYIDKFRYTECLFMFWQVRELFQKWKANHRDSDSFKVPSKKRRSTGSNFSPSKTFSYMRHSSNAGSLKKTASFRIRAQEGIKKLFGYGGEEDFIDQKSKSTPQSTNRMYDSPKKSQTMSPKSMNSDKNDNTSVNRKSKFIATSRLENSDLYKWLFILHGYTFSKFTFLFNQVLGQYEKKGQTKFDKHYNEVGINYVDRIKNFCRENDVSNVFVLYKAKRSYTTLQLHPVEGYSMEYHKNIGNCLEEEFQGIRSYPCIFFHSSESREDRKTIFEKESNLEDSLESIEEEMNEERKKKVSLKSSKMMEFWPNILNLIWSGDENMKTHYKKPLFFYDDRAKISYYYMRVGEDTFWVIVNKEDKKETGKRKKITEFMQRINEYLQNLKLFAYLTARAPEFR